jgi:LysM repeat protein
LLVGALIGVPFSMGVGVLPTDANSVEEYAKRYQPPAYNLQNAPLLRAARNFDPNPSKGGGEIIIVEGEALLPEIGPSGSLADVEDRPSSDRIGIYVVREGDSISQIAKMFDVSTNTIVWANDIKRGQHIQPGQTLVILPVTGVRHTITEQDTLASIAKKYEGDLDEIKTYNDIVSDRELLVGEVVVIPGGHIEGPAYSTRGVTVITRAHGTNGPEYEGYYIWPVVGGSKTQGLHGYNAIDIGGPYGTPVMASASGTVIIDRRSGWNGGYANYVVIRHDNGTQTLYAHNSQNIVTYGQYVVQGQVIAYMGASGNATGSHVHFEIRGAKNPF